MKMIPITKILIVEHDPGDLELIQSELMKGMPEYESKVVENEEDYDDALKNFIPDIILSDYSFPSFDGPTAFRMREEIVPETPFIFVSGNIGEENSIEYIKNGVTDYVLKDKLFTLVSKVKRALKESAERQQKSRIEKMFQDERILLRTLIDNLPASIYSKDIHSKKTLSNRTDYEYIGATSEEEVLGKDDSYFFSEATSRDTVIEEQQIFSSGQPIINQEEHQKKKDHSTTWFLKSKIPLRNHDDKIIGLLGISYDITERKEAEQQKEFDSNNLYALINNTTDLMWSIDCNFKLMTSNQPFDKMVKLVTGNTIAKGDTGFSAGFLPEKLKSYRQYYKRALAGETFTEIEHTADPYEFWTEVSFYPIRKGDEIIGTACHSRDITDRKLAEIERTRITSDLIQRNKDLEQFSYIISHNLRGPVANILGLSEAAQKMNIDTDQKLEMLQGITHSIKSLEEVILDLSAILRVKHGVSERKEIVSFSKIASGIYSSIKNLVEKENALLTWDFSEADEVSTLKGYLHSIFYNLISNSLKYRQQHLPPVIEISSRKSQKGIELIFRDNGMGIDLKRDGDQVFGLYKRFHAESAEGKGMGLYMVKTQVETMGGEISIRSEVNKGTEFLIELANDE